MRVNPTTLLFEDLSADDIWELRDLENKIRKGNIEFTNPFVEAWMQVYKPNDFDRLLVGSTVLHIRILQSMYDWMWKWYGDNV